MTIDFEHDISEICSSLRNVEGYLACEKIIVENIKKYIEKGYDDSNIEIFLKKVSVHIEEVIAENQGKADCTNFRFAGGFIGVLFKTPYWEKWVKEIEI